MGVTAKFRELVKLYAGINIEFPKLRAVTVAQWLLESGRGSSKLFIECHNAAGLKWRDEMAPFGEPVNYAAHDGLDEYVKFFSHRDFLLGYWKFIDRKPYEGWRKAADNASNYIRFLSSRGYAQDPGYVDKVLALLPEAEELLRGVENMSWKDSDITWLERNRTDDGTTVIVAYAGSTPRCIFTGDNKAAQHQFEQRFANASTVKTAPANKAVLPDLPSYTRGSTESALPQPAPQPAPQPVGGMPKIDITNHDSPNCSERGGTINGIVLHNTDGSFASALSWLCNPAAKASAHLIIGRDGRVACIVPFSKKAWHAGPANSSTIGIEIEASKSNKGMTEPQEKVLVTWLKWLMQEYKIKGDRIISHRSVMNTNCPIWIWPTEADLSSWKKKHGLA